MNIAVGVLYSQKILLFCFMRNLNKHARSLKKKWEWIQEGSPEGLKGQASERLFDQMTTILMNRGHLPWLARVKKATAVEDLFMKIDFKLDARTEKEDGCERFWIGIQIKSSFTGAQSFLESNRDSKIHVVVMDQVIDLDLLHEKLDSIYLEELERRYQPARI